MNNIMEIEEKIQEISHEIDKIRALYHYYRKIIPQTHLDVIRMKACKEKLSDLKNENENLIYKKKTLQFLIKNPKYYEDLKDIIT